MSEKLWSDVDRFIAEHFVPPDDALDAALRESAASGLPAIHVSPNQGKLLQLIVQITGARSVLEIGTLGGYSTIWMARALPADGRLITLEFDPGHAAVARKNLARAGLEKQVDLRLGPALESLPRIAEERRGPFDIVFIDADKQSTPEYFDWALRLTRPGSVILVDNVVRKGAILDAASADASIQGVRRFYENAARESRVSITALQTVGSKGYDGFALARVLPAS